MITIHIVTNNRGKLLAAASAFDKEKFIILPVKNEYREIQADSSLEIARYTALQAAKELQVPVIREDHSLYINALGIPGPYVNYFERKVPASVLLEILRNFKDRGSYFEVAAVFAEPSGETLEYSFRKSFFLSSEERGDLQGGWNKIIILEGEQRTLAEYPESERTYIWNKNYFKIADFLLKNQQKLSTDTPQDRT